MAPALLVRRTLTEVDVAAFLRRFPPFDGLDVARLGAAAEAAHEHRFPRGTVILQQWGAPATSLFVVVEGSLEVVDQGRVVDVMGEGDVFGHPSLLTGKEPLATIRAREDARCLLIEREVAREILGSRAGAVFLTASMRRRLEALEDAVEGPPLRSAGRTVGSLVRRRPVVCDPDTSVADVARAMRESATSAAIVLIDGRPGIVTDVDLRTRVLAEGRDPSIEVRHVVTSPVATIAEEALAAEALFQMVQGGFHHLPVVAASGEVVGVVTETDLIGFGADSPFSIRSAIEHASGVSEATRAARRLPGAVAGLVEGGLDPVHVGHVVGATIDVLTRRLLDLAFEEHGAPPVAWAWLALGSLGRHEQALHTDQDHGLAYDGTIDDERLLDPYFEKVASSVTRGLEEAGLPRCEGNMMAVSRGLRRSLPGWVEEVDGWMRHAERHAAGVAAVIADFRHAAGPLEIEPALERVVRSSSAAPGFLRRLAEHALEHRPPTGRLRGFAVRGSGEQAGTLDLKHGGILPITDLARFHALSVGISFPRTLDRLRVASEVGRLEERTRAGLEEAFRLLWKLRLDHQVACVRSGRRPDDLIDPKKLAPVTRRALREAFRIVRRAQRDLSVEAIWSPT